MPTLHHGNPLMVDYTPGSAVAAGDVVEVGVVPYVAHNDIEANKLGALGAGGGVYKGIQDGTIDNPGIKVYWDNVAGKFTNVSASNTHFGFSMPDQGAGNDNDAVIVQHAPSGV